jgi:hypothetical protein
MKRAIEISENLRLPLDVVTQSIAILAKKRSGKSYLARKINEQLSHAGQQIVMADPKGDWWGIRSSADGKSPGLPVVIFGGEHADIPLEPTQASGELVAKLIVSERLSALLDLGLMRKSEMRTFMTAFMETLYRLKAQEKYRTPVMLTLDEADVFAPQKPMQDEARMLGAVDDIVRRGGQRGIGCMVATQRSAVLNKNILSQTQILVGLRTIAPQDLKAFNDWIDVHGTREQGNTLMASLPSLPIGTAWFWSPGWPTESGIFDRVKVGSISTFDSGATPEVGKKRAVPKTVADIDLTAVRALLADTLERAKAEDPTELRKRIKELESKLRAVPTTTQAPKRVEVPVLKNGELKQIKTFLKIAESCIERAGETRHTLESAVGNLETVCNDLRAVVQQSTSNPYMSSYLETNLDPSAGYVVPKNVQIKNIRYISGGPKKDGDLSGPEQRIVDAIAWFNAIGVHQPSRAAVACVARYSITSSSFANPCGRLRSTAIIEYPSSDTMELTEKGRTIANRPGTPPTVRELHDRVLSVLGTPERRLLSPLLERYPHGLSDQELAIAANYSLSSSSFANPKGRLRGMGLITYPSKRQSRAADFLFPEIK